MGFFTVFVKDNYCLGKEAVGLTGGLVSGGSQSSFLLEGNVWKRGCQG